ncbi:hypothetical protein MZM54_04385 [[Brevibacterium] frigoritolerans]|nr:hypothetical protein [Peribacillus frigoritolerans]
MTAYKKYLFEEGPFKIPEFNLEGLPLSDFPVTDWEESEKSFNLSRIKDKDRFTDMIFGVDNAEVIKNYLKFDVTCNVGTLSGKMWSQKGVNFNEVIQEFNEHKIFKISGEWNEWPKDSGKFSVVVNKYIPVYDKDATDLLPRINESRTALRNELLFYISTLSPAVQKLAIDILKDTWDDFIIRPAAKGHHHFQLGGLLQHEVELMRIAHHMLEMDQTKQEETLHYIHKITAQAAWLEKQEHRREGLAFKTFSSFYEKEEHLFKVMDSFLRGEDEINRDVVIFSILVHDIGKLLEYTHHGDSSDKYKLWFPTSDIPLESEQMGVSMDSHGARIGHITLGTMFVYKYWLSGKYPLLSHTFWFDVIGCILSHHGRLDWNSTKVPETSNEWLVHLCDFIDSKYANEK